MPKTEKYGVMAQLVARLREGSPTLCGFPQNGVVLAEPEQECLIQKYGVMAQLVARLNGIQKVTSSNLVSSTKSKPIRIVSILVGFLY